MSAASLSRWVSVVYKPRCIGICDRQAEAVQMANSVSPARRLVIRLSYPNGSVTAMYLSILMQHRWRSDAVEKSTSSALKKSHVSRSNIQRPAIIFFTSTHQRIAYNYYTGWRRRIQSWGKYERHIARNVLIINISGFQMQLVRPPRRQATKRYINDGYWHLKPMTWKLRLKMY